MATMGVMAKAAPTARVEKCMLVGLGIGWGLVFILGKGRDLALGFELFE